MKLRTPQYLHYKRLPLPSRRGQPSFIPVNLRGTALPQPMIAIRCALCYHSAITRKEERP